MSLMFAPLRKYAEFNGRARRSEYSLFWLFRLLVFAALLIPFGVLAALGAAEAEGETSAYSALAGLIILLGMLVYLGLLLPYLAVTVRRLHDANMSGWLVLLGLVPLGGFVLFIFTLLDGTAGPNIYGQDPKRAAATTASLFD